MSHKPLLITHYAEGPERSAGTRLLIGSKKTVDPHAAASKRADYAQQQRALQRQVVLAAHRQQPRPMGTVARMDETTRRMTEKQEAKAKAARDFAQLLFDTEGLDVAPLPDTEENNAKLAQAYDKCRDTLLEAYGVYSTTAIATNPEHSGEALPAAQRSTVEGIDPLNLTGDVRRMLAPIKQQVDLATSNARKRGVQISGWSDFGGDEELKRSVNGLYTQFRRDFRGMVAPPHFPREFTDWLNSVGGEEEHAWVDAQIAQFASRPLELLWARIEPTPLQRWIIVEYNNWKLDPHQRPTPLTQETLQALRARSTAAQEVMKKQQEMI